MRRLLFHRILRHLDIWHAHRWRVGVFAYAILVHYALGLAMLLEATGVFAGHTASATNATHGMVRLMGVWGGSIGLILAAAMAHAALWINGRTIWPIRVALLMWQQTVMVISGISIIQSILSGSFPDGYTAPMAFILADAMDGTLLLGIMHSLALLHFIGYVILKGNQCSTRLET